MEREVFLDKVRLAVAAHHLPPAPPSDPGGLVPDLPEIDLVATFAERIRALFGEVHVDVDPIEVVAELVRAHDIDSYISWDTDQLPGVGARLQALRLPRVPSTVFTDDRPEVQSAYQPIRLGVTGAEAGFAESGSIVVRSGPGRPRMASLVPEIHVALLRRENIYRSLAHWAALHADTAADTANLVFITGPSRTADIEQILTVGVHGPRRLHVVLI